MDNGQVRALLEGLDAEAAVMQEGVDSLKVKLAEANARLSVVTEARVALRKLLPGGERPPLIVMAPDPIPAAETSDDDDDDDAQPQAPGQARIRSTSLVGEIVGAAPGPMTRREVLEAIHARGVRPDWKDPDNALGNAILRAHRRGLLQMLGDGRVAPTSYKPPSLSGEGSLSVGGSM